VNRSIVAFPLFPTLSIADHFSRIFTPPLARVNGKCLLQLRDPLRLRRSAEGRAHARPRGQTPFEPIVGQDLTR